MTNEILIISLAMQCSCDSGTKRDKTVQLPMSLFAFKHMFSLFGSLQSGTHIPIVNYVKANTKNFYGNADPKKVQAILDKQAPKKKCRTSGGHIPYHCPLDGCHVMQAEMSNLKRHWRGGRHNCGEDVIAIEYEKFSKTKELHKKYEHTGEDCVWCPIAADPRTRDEEGRYTKYMKL
jgi:hypothetical protein